MHFRLSVQLAIAKLHTVKKATDFMLRVYPQKMESNFLFIKIIAVEVHAWMASLGLWIRHP